MRCRYLGLKSVLLILMAVPAIGFAHKLPCKAQIDIELKGSAPPVMEWYSCAKDLDGKPFNRQETDRCLQSILSHSQFAAGKVVVEPGHRHTQVSFILESPPLKLTKLDFGLSTGRTLDFEGFIRHDGNVLRLGQPYDPSKEIQTLISLEEFLKSNGVAAIISRDVALDYDKKTATVVFKVWAGPDFEAREPLPGTKCDAYVANINEIDMDDNTPAPLVDAILGTSLAACFSSDAIRKAEQELNGTELFLSVRIDIQRASQFRNITLHVRAKPTVIGQISYKPYGVLSEVQTTEVPAIPLAENQAYSASAAGVSRAKLLDSFKKQGLNVKVLEEDRLEPNRRLSVVFHIIGAKLDTLLIDGKEFQSSSCCI